MKDLQAIIVILIVYVFLALFLLVFNPRFRELVSKVKIVNFFKDGRNVPLSLLIAAAFLFWSLNWGFLAQSSISLQMIWSLSYLYFMVEYRYTASSFISRFPLIGVLVLFKWLIAVDFFPENVLALLYENVPMKPIRLPLQLVAVGLDWVLHLFITYLAQRDYLSLLFLFFPGISQEYSYWRKDVFLLGVNPGAAIRGSFEEGVWLGERIREVVQIKVLGEDFNTNPSDTQIFRQDLITDITFTLFQSPSRFGALPLLVPKERLLPLEGAAGYFSLRNKLVSMDTSNEARYLKSFGTRFPGMFKGLGEEYALRMKGLVVQRAYHMLATAAPLLPTHPAYAALLSTNEALNGKKSFGVKSINTFCLLATELYLTQCCLPEGSKVVGVLQTPLDCALLVKYSEGWVKAIAFEVKTYANLERLAVYYGLDGNFAVSDAIIDTFIKQTNAGNFDEVILILHTTYKPTTLEMEKFRQAFDSTYSSAINFKYKLVFM